MSTSDAEDASPSPEHSGDEVENEMGDEIAPNVDGDASPRPASNGQKSTNSKDPSRPRRKKARRACLACQRAHLTCGTYSMLCPQKTLLFYLRIFGRVSPFDRALLILF